jgi:RND family efflux transporter MFP subunit
MGFLANRRVLVLAGFAMGACRHAEPVPPPPVPAVLTTVAHVDAEPVLSRRGAVSAGARLRLGFNVPGVIATVKVKPGSAVRKGQLLAWLKDGGAAAALQAAQANRAKAARDLGTTTALVDTGAAPAAQRNDAHSMMEIANANASIAAESVSQRRLVSPVNGTVLQRLAESGEAIAPGMPVLIVDDTERLVVKVGLPERELARVKTNQLASLLAAGSTTPVPAYVSSIGPSPLDDGLYAVEVLPTDEDRAKNAFRPGTLLTVQFDQATTVSSIRLPLEALVHRGGKTLAFVVTGQGDQSRVHIRELSTDRVDGDDVLVRSGIADGERIIREGAYFLEDGQAVRVLP